jgi:hypothetical protein
MRRFHVNSRAFLPVVLVLLSVASAIAQQGPVAAMYADDQQRGKAVAVGFATGSIPTAASLPSGQIYLTTGDLQRAFDNARFRPAAAIVPTNTELQIAAKSPATQQVLIDRVRLQPDVMRALQDQIAARRGVLDVGVGTFMARLSTEGSGQSPGSFPGLVCLLATDFPDGGAIDHRELFAQDRLRKGTAACLTAIDAAGAPSVVVPLVGAASSATQSNDPRYEGQRVLMECRLINAVAGIALGIHDFAPSRRSLREIGIIQWEREILDMFGAHQGEPLSRAAQSAYRSYATQVKLALRNGLAGQKTTTSDAAGSCNTIFNAQP